MSYIGSKRSSSLVSATEITLDGAKLKSSGDSITKSDGTTAVLSESGGTVTFTTNTAVIEGSSSGDLVRITQTGSGNALVVEDSTNPDSTPFVVDANGNVGVGTSSPSQSLTIYNAYDNQIKLQNGANANQSYEFGRNGSNGLLTFYGNQSGFTGYVFDGVDGERMRIDGSGYVRINNTGGLDGQLAVLAGDWYAGAFSNTNSSYPTIYTWNKANSGNNLFINFFTDATANLRGSIDYNRSAGQIRVNYTSDANLKNIIGDSDGEKSVEILKSTRIREFAWKDDESQKPQIGVIAQELYETYKGAVAVGGDVERTDGEGNVFTEYEPWAVDKTAFTFHLVAGWQRHEKIIKEQQTIIESQQSQIDALTAKTQEQDLTIASLISRIEALETQPT